MLPALIHRALMAAGLALILLAALAWPARHVLIPLWPRPVEEILYRTTDGDIERRLQTAGDALDSGHQLVARYRPSSLVVADIGNGVPVQGFVAGMRDGADGLLADSLPEWLDTDPPNVPARSEEVLLIELIDEQIHEVPVAELKRFYRPNRLTLVQRADMTLEFLIAAIGRDPEVQATVPEEVFNAQATETP